MAGKHYASELLKELQGIAPEVLRGEDRLPPKWELRFAPAQFRSILEVATAALAVWDSLPDELAQQVEAALAEVLDIAGEVAARPESFASREASDAQEVSESLRDRLTAVLRFFNSLEPLLPAQEASSPPPKLSDDDLEQLQRTKQELAEARQELRELSARNETIASDLEARESLVEAARSDTGAAGAEELAQAYEDQAAKHDRQWKVWGIALGCALLAALAGGYLVLRFNHPADDASTAELVSHLALDILVVGLLIYGVRVASLQFSVHRHLDAVASNKAAALNTFARIVSSGSSAETRDRLAEVLAHYVFTSDATGFLDAASDQVTLPERLVAPVTQRLSGS